MTNRTVVLRKRTNDWKPTKNRNIYINAGTTSNAGFVNPFLVVVVFAVFGGLFYVHSINQSAVKGFNIREVEKQIAEIKKDNESLRIKEAELRSLYSIEQSIEQLDMAQLSEVKYVDETEPIALNSKKK